MRTNSSNTLSARTIFKQFHGENHMALFHICTHVGSIVENVNTKMKSFSETLPSHGTREIGRVFRSTKSCPLPALELTGKTMAIFPQMRSAKVPRYSDNLPPKCVGNNMTIQFGGSGRFSRVWRFFISRTFSLV